MNIARSGRCTVPYAARGQGCRTVRRYAGAETAMISPARWLRSIAMLAALALGVLIGAEDADARLDGGLSFGKSGGRTFASSPVTLTASDDGAALDDPMLVYA